MNWKGLAQAFFALIVAVMLVSALDLALNPGYRRPLENANEDAVIGQTQAVIAAQLAYASTNNAFGQFNCLGNPPSCGWAPGTTPFIEREVAALQPLQGYRRSFFPGPAKVGSPDVRGLAAFAYVAVPVTPGVTGRRGFCGDDTGRLCYTTDGSPPPVVDGRCGEPCIVLR